MSRFVAANPLVPADLRATLIANGRKSATMDNFDPRPVAKLFTPDAAATWLITEGFEEQDGALCLFGLMDLGVGCPELGYAMLGDIEAVRGRFGLPVERDLFFRAKYRLSVYTDHAVRAGAIVA